MPAAVGIVHRGEARRLPAPRRKRCGDTPGRKIPDPAALSSVGLGAGIRRTHPFARLPALCRREADRTGPGERHTGRRRKQLPLPSRHASVRKLPAGVRRQRRTAHDGRNHRCTGAALHRLSGGKGRRRPFPGRSPLRGDMSLPQRVRSRTSARIWRDTFPLRKPACGDRIRGGFARQRRRAHAALRRPDRRAR